MINRSNRDSLNDRFTRRAADSGDAPSLSATLPTVGFSAPMLGLIAARVKSLDMRLAADPSTALLRPGSLFWGYQGGAAPFIRLCRV